MILKNLPMQDGTVSEGKEAGLKGERPYFRG